MISLSSHSQDIASEIASETLLIRVIGVTDSQNYSIFGILDYELHTYMHVYTMLT